MYIKDSWFTLAKDYTETENLTFIQLGSGISLIVKTWENCIILSIWVIMLQMGREISWKSSNILTFLLMGIFCSVLNDPVEIISAKLLNLTDFKAKLKQHVWDWVFHVSLCKCTFWRIMDKNWKQIAFRNKYELKCQCI